MAKKFNDGAEGEFEIQALVYMGLVSMGYRVRGEVPSVIVFPTANFGRNARFDLVVFDNDWKPLEIIETKHPNYRMPFADSAQCARYRQYGVPVHFAKSTKTAYDLLEKYRERRAAYDALYGLSDTGPKIFMFMELLAE